MSEESAVRERWLREVDALVGEKVMGIPVAVAQGQYECGYIDGDIVDGRTVWTDPFDGVECGDPIREYTISGGAMLAVIERMVERGAAIDIWLSSHESLPGMGGTVLGEERWEVNMVPAHAEDMREVTAVVEKACSLPLAVSLAALRALGVDVPEEPGDTEGEP